METRRLKNIAILILLLLNALLLLVLIYQDVQGEKVKREAVDAMAALFAAEDLSFARDADPTIESLSPLLPVRQSEAEGKLASFLLGETITGQSEGGGIVSYSAQAGILQFRSSGSFDSVRLRRPVADADGFVQEFCNVFGYADPDGTIVDGSGKVTIEKRIALVPVYGCTVTLTFENGFLTSVVGAYVDTDNAQADAREHLTCMSAMLRFFDYRRAEGVVCSVIEEIWCAYQLQNAGGTPQLRPIWVVETDTHAYLVDGLTGEVSRK